MDVKKSMNFEKKLPREDREIYILLKPFARFLTKEEFEELFSGMVEEKNLRQRLNQLNAFHELGLKTYEDIEKYLEVDFRRNRESRKKQNFYENSSTNIKLVKEFSSIHEDISNTEKDFIRKKEIPYQLYCEIKNKILKESKKCIKSILLSTNRYNLNDIEEIADFVVNIKKNE